MSETPNIITAVKDKVDGSYIEIFITRINNPMKDKNAPIRCVKPLVG